MLSNRLVGGVQEEGVNLALLYIPGLSRYHIGKLVGAGYGYVNSLRDANEVELGQLLPKRLVIRIQKKMKEDNNQQKMLKAKWIVQDENCELVILPSPLKITDTTSAFHNLQPVSASSPSKTENQELKTVLQIDKYLPGRIIFEEKEVEVTAKEFSLIYLLSQNRGKTITYSDLLKTLWTENEYSTYVQITSHLYKIRRAILKTIGNNKKNNKRVKDILKVVSRRGIMLNLEENKLKIS